MHLFNPLGGIRSAMEGFVSCRVRRLKRLKWAKKPNRTLYSLGDVAETLEKRGFP